MNGLSWTGAPARGTPPDGAAEAAGADAALVAVLAAGCGARALPCGEASVDPGFQTGSTGAAAAACGAGWAGEFAVCLRLLFADDGCDADGEPGIGGIVCGPTTLALDWAPAVTAATAAFGVSGPPLGSGFMMLTAGMESAEGKSRLIALLRAAGSPG